MEEINDDGYTLSDDKARLDVPRVTEWLSTDAYWALGRPRATVEASIAGSAAYGIYAPDGGQAGFCRVVTDGVTFGWLCDVYIDRAHRGKGLGHWMVEVVREVYRAAGLRRLVLATDDAHGVYAAAGFTPLPEPGKWMELAYFPQPGRAEPRD
jgi:GNAT superfamily N-acetyltransferase